jgi:benzoyl-CoA reductase subunit D
MITAGIDLGARSIKVVIVELAAGGEVRVLGQHRMFPESLDMDEAARRAYDDALVAAGLGADEVARIVATGVARKQAHFAHEDVTEVAAGGQGVAHLFPAARTVIDVGAEEARAIRLDASGRVTDFAGNEKCAAGAGAFAESMARALQLTLADFGAASLRSTQALPMNAQCTVFAESEVVSLIHAATPTEDIARAVLDAVASRICAMARRVGIEREVVLIGGMAHNPGFTRALAVALEIDGLLRAEHPEYVGALGAALIAARH